MRDRRYAVLAGWILALAWWAVPPAAQGEPFSAERSPIRLSPVPPVPDYGFYHTQWRRWPEVPKPRKKREPKQAEPEPKATRPAATPDLESLPDEPPSSGPMGSPDDLMPPEESLLPPLDPNGPVPGPPISSPPPSATPGSPDSLAPPAVPPGTAPDDSLLPPVDDSLFPPPGDSLLPPEAPSGGTPPTGQTPMSYRPPRRGGTVPPASSRGYARRTSAGGPTAGWQPPRQTAVATAPVEEAVEYKAAAGPALAAPGNRALDDPRPSEEPSPSDERWQPPRRTRTDAPTGAAPDRFHPRTPMRPAVSQRTPPPTVTGTASDDRVLAASYLGDPVEPSEPAETGGLTELLATPSEPVAAEPVAEEDDPNPLRQSESARLTGSVRARTLVPNPLRGGN